MSLIRTFFGFVTAAALIYFAVANRQSTELYFSPVHDPLQTPLYLIALLFMLIGFILGGLVVWINGGSLRKIKRQQRKAIKNLEKEVGQLKKQHDPQSATPPSDFFPALPKSEKSAIK